MFLSCLSPATLSAAVSQHLAAWDSARAQFGAAQGPPLEREGLPVALQGPRLALPQVWRAPGRQGAMRTAVQEPGQLLAPQKQGAMVLSVQGLLRPQLLLTLKGIDLTKQSARAAFAKVAVQEPHLLSQMWAPSKRKFAPPGRVLSVDFEVAAVLGRQAANGLPA